MPSSSRRPPRLVLIGGLVVAVAVAVGAIIFFRQTPGSANVAKPAGTTSSTAGKADPSGTAAAGGVRLVPVDGGTAYYGKFANPLPTSASFFPIAIYYAAVGSQSDIDRDKAAGINTYVELDDNSNFDVVNSSGMHVIARIAADNGAATNGWSLDDEVDMRFGPGDSQHVGGDGGTCVPKDPGCGYTVMKADQSKFPSDKLLRYANYGKGVLFWLKKPDAAHFVNDFQDVVSADSYWFQDSDLCSFAQGGTFYPKSDQVNGLLPDNICHIAANYGKEVSRVRSLESPAGSKPVWAFVEDGHVSSGAKSITAPTPEQVTAGVWSSIIHGARGVIYFNNAYGGCSSSNVLADPCYSAVRAAVTTTDAEITTLAPVLNAPFAEGITTASAGIDTSTKWYDGHLYVLTGSNQSAAQKATVNLSCVGNATVTVLTEDRTISMSGGTFSDTFADSNAIHLYRVDGGSNCGLQN